MKKDFGFSLIEIVIAMALAVTVSVFIIVSMKNSFKFNAMGVNKINVNEQAFLVLNQLEKDFSSAYIFSFDTSTLDTKNPINKSLDSKDSKDSKDGDKNLKLKIFDAKIQDDDGLVELNKNKQKLFQSLNFITSSSLVVGEKNKYNLVRVLYELKRDKQSNKDGKNGYTLMRKETKNLENLKFQDDFESDSRKTNKENVFTCVIAKNIKEFSLQFFKKEEDPKKNQTSIGSKEKQIYKSFEWGSDDDKTKGTIPFFVKYHIVFFNDEKNKEFVFNGSIKFFNEKLILKADNTTTPTVSAPSSPPVQAGSSAQNSNPALAMNNLQQFFSGLGQLAKGEEYIAIGIKGQPPVKMPLSALNVFTKIIGQPNFKPLPEMIHREV